MGGQVDAKSESVSAGAPPALATDLIGDLPCVGCSYNLKGLSIRALCPECGTPVRATILARVDPRAEELKPLRTPRLTAFGLMLWAWAAVAAAMCVWGVRLGDLTTILTGVPVGLGILTDLSLLAIALSGIGACAIVCPVREPRSGGTWKAGSAVLAYALLGVVHFALLHVYDGNTGVPYVWTESGDPTRSWVRLAEGVVIAVIILGLRPNAVSLAERSLIMRTGRVDTQPLPALIAALGIAAAGDLVLILGSGFNGTIGALSTIAALVLIAVGSFLFTLGLVGVAFDTMRLRPVLIVPTLGLSDVLSDDRDEARDGDR